MSKLLAIDFYEFMRTSIHTRQIKVDECVLINYQCWETGSSRVWFKEAHLVFILSGQKSWEFDGEMFQVKPGDVVFIKQGNGTIHHSSSSEFCALILFLPHEFISNFLLISDLASAKGQKDNSVESLIKIENSIILESYRNSLLSYLTEHGGIDFASIARIKLHELLHYIFAQKTLSGIASHLKSMVDENSAHLQNIVEQNFTLPLDLDEFAEMCNMSLSTFKRKFKDAYGTAPGIWLIEKRITLSKKLLKKTNMTVAEVAVACGFNSPSYFVRAFKKYTHNSPLQFRKTIA